MTPECRSVFRDNNVDQALRALKKKLQREGVFREMKLKQHYEKPSEKKCAREGRGHPPRPQAGAQEIAARRASLKAIARSPTRSEKEKNPRGHAPGVLFFRARRGRESVPCGDALRRSRECVAARALRLQQLEIVVRIIIETPGFPSRREAWQSLSRKRLGNHVRPNPLEPRRLAQHVADRTRAVRPRHRPVSLHQRRQARGLFRRDSHLLQRPRGRSRGRGNPCRTGTTCGVSPKKHVIALGHQRDDASCPPDRTPGAARRRSPARKCPPLPFTFDTMVSSVTVGGAARAVGGALNLLVGRPDRSRRRIPRRNRPEQARQAVAASGSSGKDGEEDDDRDADDRDVDRPAHEAGKRSFPVR